MKTINTFDQIGSPWGFHDAPEVVGYSKIQLAEVEAYTGTISTHAAVVVVQGKILWEYGNTTDLSYIASVRKSVLSMLYGKYVANGSIDLELTLADLELNDVQGLLPVEKRATVKDIITSRSGIYHPAANAGDDTGTAGKRGSKNPGDYFLYNNWDFNAAGTIFEKLTGLSIYDALGEDFVQPLGFEHWNRDFHKRTGDVSRSLNLAYHMVFSTRDMAQIGELMLREGRWDGSQLIPENWVRLITSVNTPNSEMNPPYLQESEFGYGYMWWVWDGKNVNYPFNGAYTARGYRGQNITIIPELDMVVAHKTIVKDHATSWADYLGILTRIVDSKLPS